jgi:ribonuclease BN (tRNA processing enzyme)
MFQLQFLGDGGALNAARGNTAAFFIIKQELFLLDCGGTVVRELDQRQLLEMVKAVHVIITHCHCDHVGSLADLIYYAKYRYKIPIDILWDSEHEQETKRLAQVQAYLTYYAVSQHCQITDTKMYQDFGELDGLHLLPTTHDSDLHCVSVVIRHRGLRFFYSGDTNTLETLWVAEQKYGPMEHIYLEVCSVAVPSHLYFERLLEAFSREQRHKITLMHFNDSEIAEKAWKHWFQLPSS